MSLLEYAKDELKRVDLEYDGMIEEAVLGIVDAFAKQGHSGGSAAITISAAQRLLCWKPLSPLTGADDEWTEVSEEDGVKLYQSKRCPSVFKNAERAWDIDLPRTGQEWETISFPYTPGQEPFDRRASKIGGTTDA